MGLDDRYVGAACFFATGTVIFEPLGLAASMVLCVVLGVFGFLVGMRTTRSRSGRGL